MPVDQLNTRIINENSAAFSQDARLLFFSSDRPGGSGGLDLYVSLRTNRDNDKDWSVPLNLGPTINTFGADLGPAYVEDEAGLTVLYFTRNSGPGADIFRAQVIDPAGLRRDTNGHGKVDNGVFEAPVGVTELNSPAGDASPAIRIDRLELFFHSNRTGAVGLTRLEPSAFRYAGALVLHTRIRDGSLVVPHQPRIPGEHGAKRRSGSQRREQRRSTSRVPDQSEPETSPAPEPEPGGPTSFPVAPEPEPSAAPLSEDRPTPEDRAYVRWLNS